MMLVGILYWLSSVTSMHWRIRVSTSYPALLEAKKAIRVIYLVEFPVSAVEHHLEGNVGAVLNTWDSRCAGGNADASRCARSLEITDDELVSAGRGMEVVEGRRGSGGRNQHSD